MRPSWPTCAYLGGCEFHGFDNLRIGGAATEIAGEIVPDLVVVRVRMLLEQLACHQHEAWRAEPALGRARFQERLLHGAERPVRRQLLHGGHTLAVRERREVEAAGHSSVVNQHRAAAAQALRAALARAEEIKAIAQHFDDGVVGRDLGCDLLAVEGEMDRAGHVGLTGVARAAASSMQIVAPSPARGEGATTTAATRCS